MQKIWIIFKAIVLFISTNKEIIEKHIAIIKEEINKIKEAKNSAVKKIVNDATVITDDTINTENSNNETEVK